ncbi:MAG: hypothetical protein H0W83_10220 [Planctomycetes bacterium]|nr:hypothetical protein [Planctomycetota bacterium]
MSHFEPRRIFRRARLQTLRAYFEHKGIVTDVAWDELEDNDWRTVADAWARLGDEINAQVAADFYDFDVMAEEAGVRALLEVFQMMGKDWSLALAAVDDPLEGVMRAFMEQTDLWNLATRLAVSDTLAHSRSHHRYDGLPGFTADIGSEACERLREGLSAFFRRVEGRGQHGVVESAERAGGVRLFTAYLSDYPLAREILVNRHELQRAVDAGRVFTLVVSCPTNGGAVDISASGGRKVRDEILTIFGRSMDEDLELVVDPMAQIGRYELNHLRRRWTLPFDPTVVDDARIRSVRFRVIGGGRRSVEIKADPNESPLDIYEVLTNWFNQERVPSTNIDFQSVTFAVRLPATTGRLPCFTFYATRSGSSNVRSRKEEYRRIGEKLIEQWRIYVPQSATGTAGAGPAS